MIDLEAALRLADEAERVAGSATPGPWNNAGWDSKRGQCVLGGKHKFPICQVFGVGPAFEKPEGGSMSKDAAFIAHARTSVPALASTVRGLVERVRELEEQIIQERLSWMKTTMETTIPKP